MLSSTFVGVDWGTSSFRAWLSGPDTGQRLICRSDRGMSRLGPGEFAPYLESVLRVEGVVPGLPVVICGMAGARDGWQEVPYRPVPADPRDVARHATQVTAGPYRCTLLPGVSLARDGRFDVMRGEETILFGARALGARDGVFCLPGTHSKWCRLESGRLVDWQTVMTGEVFALLSSHSTLSAFCSGATRHLHDTPAFETAIRDVLDGQASALHDLFSIRARALLDADADHKDFPARLSGLLIGQEIAGLGRLGMGPDGVTAPVCLISDGPIRDAYAAALAIAGYHTVTIDAADATIAGLRLLADQLTEARAPT